MRIVQSQFCSEKMGMCYFNQTFNDFDAIDITSLILKKTANIASISKYHFN